MFKPCCYRRAEEDGRIICEKIIQGDNEVSPNVCRTCPAMAINCGHLRFSLQKISPNTILVRYGNGRTEIWNDEPPRIEFVRGACATKVMPIEGPRQCVGCTLRCPTVVEQVERQKVPQVAPQIIPFPAREAVAQQAGG